MHLFYARPLPWWKSYEPCLEFFVGADVLGNLVGRGDSALTGDTVGALVLCSTGALVDGSGDLIVCSVGALVDTIEAFVSGNFVG